VGSEDKVSVSSIVVAVKDQVSCDLAGESVILHLKSGVYYGLNSLGTRIWNLIQDPVSVDEVRAILVKEYDVEPQRCERDLMALLQQLADAGLVKIKAKRDG
jgi:hypothetical protein